MSFTKNLIKHSSIYSLSGILFKGANFFLLPIYTRVLTPEELGTIAILATFFGLYKTVTFLGSQTGIMREYLHETNSKDDKLIVLSTAHWSLIFILGFFSLPPIYFALPITKIIGIEEKYAILIALLFLNNFYKLIKYARDTYFRIKEFSKKALFWNNIEHFTDLILSIILVIFLKMNVFGVIYAQVAAPFIVIIIFSPWFFKTLRYGFKKEVFFKIFSYGSNFMFLNITSWVMNLSDRWILNEYWDMSVVGLYSIGYRFSNFIQILNDGFKNQWGTSLYKMGSKRNVSDLLVSTFIRYLTISGLIWVFITLFIKEILFILTPVLYHNTYKFIPVILFGYIFVGLGNIWSAGLHLQNKGKWFWILSSIGAFVNIILNLIFIPKYGMIAAAFTTAIAFSVQPIGYFMITKKAYDLIVPVNKISILFISFLLIYLFSIYILVDNIFISVIIKLIIFVMFIFILNIFSIISSSDKNQIKIMFLDIINRKF